jgi:hypothetical protein
MYKGSRPSSICNWTCHFGLTTIILFKPYKKLQILHAFLIFVIECKMKKFWKKNMHWKTCHFEVCIDGNDFCFK